MGVWEKTGATQSAHIFMHKEVFSPSAKGLGGEFVSCWRWFFSILSKIIDWEGLLGTLGDDQTLTHLILELYISKLS
jgi:hypothetical protein